MEPELFLEKFRSKYTSGVVSKLSYFGLTWDQWAKFAKMTRSLDYGCNFNANKEVCSQGSYYKSIKDVCCCGNCQSYVGYLKRIPSSRKITKEIASLFDDKHGFWRKKEGCILPAKCRSDTCIAYRCPEAREQRNRTSDGHGTEMLEQMSLYFLETFRLGKLSATQVRTIIEELIKTPNF